MVLGYIQFETASTAHAANNFDSENSWTFGNTVSNELAKEIVSYVQGKIDEINSPQQATSQLSVADEIFKYKQLCDAGIISVEEFEKKKKELL